MSLSCCGKWVSTGNGSLGAWHGWASLCWVIQGQQQVADKRRTSPASDRGSSAQVVAVLMQGAMNGY